jgi:5-amino-6-(5-phosphoribosylamino)uracil reductase
MTSDIGPRPYVLLSCSLSLDGYLDTAAERRLVLSNAADLARVDQVRAGCDAILVGAGTVRCDNPRLLVRSQALRAERLVHGLPPTPMKVTLTSSGRLDPGSRFFTSGRTEKLVYCSTAALARAGAELAGVATVVDGGCTISMDRVTQDLHARGVRRLMVEGGGRVHTQLLTQGLADELQMVVAPLFVGDSRAPRFVDDGRYPWDEHHRADLAEVRRIGDMVLLRYALSDRFSDTREPIHAN